MFPIHRKTLPLLLISLSVLALAACGSSGGSGNPPPPPEPMAPPPPPPPEPTFEERLADLAAFDPNPCRAATPGFEALGGWLQNDGRELGTSRVWISDKGPFNAAELNSNNHGALVWDVFTNCAVRSSEAQYYDYVADDDDTITPYHELLAEQGEDLINSRSRSPDYEDVPLPEPSGWIDGWNRRGQLGRWNDGTHDGQRVLTVQSAGNNNGTRTSVLQEARFQLALQHTDIALWIVVGGHVGDGDERAPASGSSLCGAADPLCLFAPWGAQRQDGTGTLVGTSVAAPRVTAALDTVWTVWPDMDILDLRNLAFDCAENMPARDGDTSTDRTYSYSNGREFMSTTNSTWGHGILSLTCLFTPNGGLQDPTTGEAIAGGIFGPIAGPVTGASIMGVDYTGRDFGYGFARPVARENFALAATGNLRPVQAVYAMPGFRYNRAAVHGALWRSDAISVNLTAAGNAIGVATEWRAGNFTLRSGLAAQPEGVGSVTGSRAFRAPSTVSAAITAAYGRALPQGFSMHLQADYWQTLATQGRSLWQSAELSESRISAALVKRAGRHEFALQGAWQSGLAGSLDVDGRSWPVAGIRESSVWLTWRSGL